MSKNAADIGPQYPQVVVLFGATGDLSRRKLLPGLFHLVGEGCPVLGLGFGLGGSLLGFQRAPGGRVRLGLGRVVEQRGDVCELHGIQPPLGNVMGMRMRKGTGLPLRGWLSPCA